MSTAIVPISATPIAVRVATLADLPFMDALQKRHGRALGYFPTKQFEEYIAMGAVLVAEAVTGRSSLVTGQGAEGAASSLSPLSLTSDKGPLTNDSRLGYVISRDRYLKRDELGVIYQLCVAPGEQRRLIGAALVREVFHRAAYGCRLFCCWCAQDLDANYFWESLGFVPIAFRAGSDKKRRVHIFWQRRIDRGVLECGGIGVSACEDAHADTPIPRHPDTPRAAPYWYPFQTSSGAIRRDRIVLPIPPGVHWRDVRPPDAPTVARPAVHSGPSILPEPSGTALGKRRAKNSSGGTRRPRDGSGGPGAGKVAILVGGRIKYVDRPGARPPAAPAPAAEQTPRRAKKEKSPPAKIDPKYLAAARELRDRYLERVNESPLALPAPAARYDVSRALPAAAASAAAASSSMHPPMVLLKAS